MADPAVWLSAWLGLVVGSFLNVCIFRIPRGASVVWPRSRCARCDRFLEWYENVPVVSWAFLRARCRTCGERISWRYPVVELTSGIAFVTIYLMYGPTVLGVSRVLLACALIVLFVIDLQHRILPNVITLPGIILGFLFSFLLPDGSYNVLADMANWQASLLGIVLGGAVPYAIAEAYLRLRGVEGLGMGDVKMLAMIGAFLGWELMLVTLLVATFAGSVVGLGCIAAGKGTKYALPFGTFLAAGAVVAMMAGHRLLIWYASFYRDVQV